MAMLGEMLDVEAPPASKGWKVSPAEQSRRDQDRRRIVSDELESAKKRLAAGDARAQGDIDALNKELAGIKAPAVSAAPAELRQGKTLGQWLTTEESAQAAPVDRSIPTAEGLARPDLEVKPEEGGIVRQILKGLTVKGLLEPRRITQEAVKGLGEAGLTLATGAVAAPIAAATGVLTAPFVGGQRSRELMGKVLEGNVYQPRTEVGKEIVGGLARGAEAAKLPPLGVQELAGMAPAVEAGAARARAIPGQIRAAVKATETGLTREQAASRAAAVNEGIKSGLTREQAEAQFAARQTAPEAPLAGFGKMGAKSVGAAEAESGLVRQEKARGLDIPIELSKDQVTRNPADVRFARETAKDPVFGQPLQEHYARQNDQIQQNLQKRVEDTGAEMIGVQPAQLAESLEKVTNDYKTSRKAEVNAAWKAADEAGQTSEQVSYEPLRAYLDKFKDRPNQVKNNPILGIIEESVKANDPNGTGQMSLAALDDIYKTIVEEVDPSARGSMFHGTKMKAAINAATEGKGGDLYRAARQASKQFYTDFDDTPVVKNITAMKKNSTQRVVAMEELVDKSILRGSTDDVRRLFSMLERSGPEGQQMIKELQGYVADHIRNEATKGVQLDINGRPYVSTAKLDSTINKLDKSGKLDLLFGKRGADQYRTLADVTKDIQTVPQGTTNPSGTASTLLAAMAEMGAQTAMTGVPVPVVMIGKQAVGAVKSKRKMTKIREFVDYGKKD